MKIVNHWMINRKGKRVFLKLTTMGKGLQLKFGSGREAKLVIRSLAKVCETAERDDALQELFQRAVDGMHEGDLISASTHG